MLEDALARDPEAGDVRELLAARYRAAEQWDALAELLSAESPAATLPALREAEHVGEPHGAGRVIEARDGRAVGLHHGGPLPGGLAETSELVLDGVRELGV